MTRSILRTRPSVLACTTVLFCAGIGPAAAQFYERPAPAPYGYNRPPPPYGYSEPQEGPADRPLAPFVIVDRLDARGYDDIGRPRLDGQVYVVEATSPAGGRERLIVDAFRFRILQRTALYDPRSRDLDEDDGGDDAPPPGRRLGSLPSPPYGAPSDRGGEFRGRGEESGVPAPDGRQTGRSLDIGSVEARPLPPPSDPRLGPGPDAAPQVSPAPSAGQRPLEIGPRSAERPAAPELVRPSAPPNAASPVPPPPGGVSGVNPDRAGEPRPKPAVAARPPKPAADKPIVEQPAARPAEASKPEDGKPAATADAGPRKPVRMIEGVTRMDGGQQAAPGPQNGLESKPK